MSILASSRFVFFRPWPKKSSLQCYHHQWNHYKNSININICHRQRLFSTTVTNSANDILSNLSSEDIFRALSRLSPLALETQARHNKLAELQVTSGLSSIQSKQLTQLAPIADVTSRLSSIRNEFLDISTLLTDPSSDNDLRTLAKEEEIKLLSQLEKESTKLLYAIINTDVMIFENNDDDNNIEENEEEEDDNDLFENNDSSSALVEIRAGTGGDEAALFAAELVEMYNSLARHCNWKVRIVSRSETDLKGTRETIMKITGDSILSQLSIEAGVHRVQRVPKTETQGRLHTSTASVAVLPDISTTMTSSSFKLKSNELRFDVYRASGAGGQHVNTTESAVRVTHIPSGIVATCQDERSQHRNRAVALESLTMKILTHKLSEQAKKRLGKRREQLGCTAGERSDRIRTYNFPQRRVTDHRISILPQVEKLIPSLNSYTTSSSILTKSVSLENAMQGGSTLVKLMCAVRTTQTLNKIADLIRIADTKKSNDSEEWCDALFQHHHHQQQQQQQQHQHQQ